MCFAPRSCVLKGQTKKITCLEVSSRTLTAGHQNIQTFEQISCLLLFAADTTKGTWRAEAMAAYLPSKASLSDGATPPLYFH